MLLCPYWEMSVIRQAYITWAAQTLGSGVSALPWHERNLLDTQSPFFDNGEISACSDSSETIVAVVCVAGVLTISISYLPRRPAGPCLTRGA